MTNKRRFTISVLCLLMLIVSMFAFSACGGVENFEISFIVDGETYQTITTDGKSTITIPEDPTKEGYTFDGWYWDKDVWSKPFTANSLLDAPISSDMKVYAKWRETNPACQHRDSNDDLLCDNCSETFDDGEEIYQYTVTFEVNGGTAVAPITASVIEESPITTKDYNTFVGWYTDVSLQESTRVSFPFALTADITLYAKWTVDFTEGLQLTLQTSTNTYFVTGYTGTESNVVIPSTYKGLDVTGINARAFEGNSMITEIVIPDSVITVGLGAFSECYNLASVDMSDQLQLLGASAFSNCIKLESIDLPDTLQNIGGEAFFGCTALRELYLSNELENIGTNIIRGCTSMEKLTLPGRITLISLVGDTNDNIPSSLKEIVFANGSDSICENALYNCSQIENITIPSSVKTILNSAFYGCMAIESLVIPDSVTSIGKSAIGGCTKLESLTLPFVGAVSGGTEDTHFGYIFGAESYSYNGSFVPQSLKKVILTNTSSIDDNAFYGCYGITDIVIPASIAAFGMSAFEDCSGLCGVYVSDLSMWCGIDFGNEKANPLYYAKKLYVNDVLVTDLSVPDTVAEIKPYAFYNCELDSVHIPESVRTCGFASFGGCTASEITIPFLGESLNGDSNTHFGYIFGASSYAQNINCVPFTLKNVVITGGEQIDTYAFYKCNNITSIVLPETIVSIGDYAFKGCELLSDLQMSSRVACIGKFALEDCVNLASIAIPNALTSLDNYVFAGWSGLTNLTLPESIISIGDYAFMGCLNLRKITIPGRATLPSLHPQNNYCTL